MLNHLESILIVSSITSLAVVVFWLLFADRFVIKEGTVPPAKSITREEAIVELQQLLLNERSIEDTHITADMILLDLVGDVEIRSLFKRIEKGHSLSEAS